METWAGEVVVRTSRAWQEGLLFTQHNPVSWGTRKIVHKCPLGTDRVTDSNTSPSMQGVAAFVQHESINLGKRDLGPWLALHVGQGGSEEGAGWGCAGVLSQSIC